MIGRTIRSYRLVAKLGEGAMGVVYAAEHIEIGRRAAVKVLLPEYAANQDITTRFFNEAKATALIKHPGLVEIFDSGREPDGTSFLIMELLDGETLASKIARERTIPLKRLMVIARQIAVAIEAAHRKGIVHRDLKPDNIFVCHDPELQFGIRVKVLDFGIAKLGDPTSGKARTRTAAILGTAPYMSPEQCRGAGHVDSRSDIYSLGCILFEMACGRPPFVAEASGDYMVAHLRDASPVPSSVARTVPPWLDALILRALEKDVARRFQTLAELIAELERHARKLLKSSRKSSSDDETRPGRPLDFLEDEATRAVERAPARDGTQHSTRRPTTTLSATASENVPLPASPRPGRLVKARQDLRWFAALVAAVLAAAVGIGAVVARKNGPSIAVAAPAAPSTTAQEKPRPSDPITERPIVTQLEVPQAPRTFSSLTIESSPPGADVFVEGERESIGSTPITKTVERKADTSMRFLIRLEGYIDEHVSMVTATDGHATIALTPIVASPAVHKSKRRKPQQDGPTVLDPFGS